MQDPDESDSESDIDEEMIERAITESAQKEHEGDEIVDKTEPCKHKV